MRGEAIRSEAEGSFATPQFYYLELLSSVSAAVCTMFLGQSSILTIRTTEISFKLL